MMAIYNVDDHQVIIKRLQRSGYEFIGIRNVVGNDGAKRDFVVYGNYNEDQTECCSLEFVQDEEQAFVVIEHVKLDQQYAAKPATGLIPISCIGEVVQGDIVCVTNLVGYV